MSSNDAPATGVTSADRSDLRVIVREVRAAAFHMQQVVQSGDGDIADALARLGDAELEVYSLFDRLTITPGYRLVDPATLAAIEQIVGTAAIVPEFDDLYDHVRAWLAAGTETP